MTSLLAAQVVARRVFSSLYIYLDIAFLVLLCALLFFKKRHLTLLFGLAGGVLYMLVDYGIFHLLTGSRHIEGGSLFWVLLWMSMSYGITNFVLLWVWMGKDRRAVEWTLLIFVWWIAAPLIASAFGQTFPTVAIWRETEGYHGYMALVLLAGYLFGILYNLRRREREKRLPLLRLFMLGVAESFTGGGVVSRLIEIPGASEVVYEGIVAYANGSKMRRLGVTAQTLEKQGAVSDETAYEMAVGLLERGNCSVAVATTGIAGPASDGTSKPVGLNYIAVGTKESVFVYKYIFKGDRRAITARAINQALFLIYKLIK